MNKIPNIFLIGPMGSGKTTLGRCLAEELNLKFYDSDKEIEKRTGVTIPWIFDVEGEPGFRKRERQVINDLTMLSGIVLATGGGVVLAPENRASLAARGFVVYLMISIDQQIARIKKSNRPLVTKSTNLEATLKELQSKRAALYEEIADFMVSTDNRSVQALVNEIITHIKQQQIPPL